MKVSYLEASRRMNIAEIGLVGAIYMDVEHIFYNLRVQEFHLPH